MEYHFDRMHEWPKPAKIGIIALSFLVLLTLGYLFDIASLKTATSVAQQREQNLLNDYRSTLAKQTQIEANILQLPVLNQVLNTFNQQFIPGNDITEFLDHILKIGAQYSLQFSLFEPGKKIQEGLVLKVPLHIVATGTFDQLGSFINDIANMNKMVRVSDFSISTSEHDPNQALSTEKKPSDSFTSNAALRADLTIEVYEKNI